MEMEDLFTVGEFEDAPQIIIGGQRQHTPIDEVINAIMASVIKQTETELTPIVQALVDSRGSGAGVTAVESLLNTIVCRLAKSSKLEDAAHFVLSHDVSPVEPEQISRLIKSIAVKCIVEICAVNEAIVEERMGVQPEKILKDIKKRIREKTYRIDCLSGAVDPNREEEPDDHDPINGRYVNEAHEKLLLQSDAAATEQEKKSIHKKCVAIYKREAKRNNPLALFYLGVIHLTGGGVTKDLQKGRALLEQAHKMGVRRAEGFLLSYFEDYKAEG